jgi:LytS/YehU family sensor histidine kinase
VRHGIAKNAGAGVIVIRAVRVDGQLEISVSDNRPGILEGGILGSKGIGLDNTRKRLRQLYGNRAVLVLRPRGRRGGAVAMISIPFRMDESP